MPRSSEELRELLAEQIAFLRSSASAYDRGDLPEAKRLATTVSTLVNKTRTSDPLLAQMGLLEEMLFISYAEPLEFRYPKVALVMIMANTDTGVSFTPLCNSQFARFQPFHWISFPSWWTEEPIYQVTMPDESVATLNRLDLVRYLRSKDGGSHIDADLDAEAYERLSRTAETGVRGYSNGHMAGIIASDQGDGEPILDGHLAVMRHIAWEVEQSIIQMGLAQPAN